MDTVVCRIMILKHKVYTSGEFFEDCAKARGHKSWVVVGGKPSRDSRGLDAQALHHLYALFKRRARILVRMLLSGESLLFVVENDSRTAFGSDFDKCNPCIV